MIKFNALCYNVFYMTLTLNYAEFPSETFSPYMKPVLYSDNEFVTQNSLSSSFEM